MDGSDKKWMGTRPSKCEMCTIQNKTTDLSKFSYFVDGKTVYGYWAIMCPSCDGEFGVGYGLGLGQKYNMKTLVKMEG